MADSTTDPCDLALARARVVLADVAPEIPADDVTHDATLEGLGLDTVSVWALATGLEKLAKVEIADSAICEAKTIGDLAELAISDAAVPEFPSADDGAGDEEGEPAAESVDGADEPQDAADATAEPDSADDLAAAAAELAKLFNS